MPISAEDQKKLYAEADARFQAQTGVSRKLNPKNPIDQKLIPVWLDVYSKIRAQFLAGTLGLTFDHPFVGPALVAAEGATARAAASMDAAATAANAAAVHDRAAAAGDIAARAAAADARAAAGAHLVDARAAHIEAQQALASAAAQQPPTISHAHVQHAAHQVQQFVMNGAGMGVPVFEHGGDVVTAMQAQEAPANAAAVISADPTGGVYMPPAGLPLPDFTTPPHARDGKHGLPIWAVAAFAAATLGVVVFAFKGERKSRKAASRELGAGSTGAYWAAAAAHNRRRIA